MGLNVLSLFDGIGTGYAAFQRADVEIDKYEAYETDKQAIDIAKQNNPEISEQGNAFEEDFEKYRGKIDYLINGSPCFAAGTLVLTKRGYVPIEYVRVGDEVLTHNNRFKKVVVTGNKIAKTYPLNTGFSNMIYTTREHPFYVKNNNGEISWKEIGEVDFLKENIALNIFPNKYNNEYNKAKRLSLKQLERCGLAVSKGSVNNFNLADEPLKEAIISSWTKMNFNPKQSEDMFAFRKREIPFDFLALSKNKLKSFLKGYLRGLDAIYDDSFGFVVEFSFSHLEIIHSLVLAWTKAFETTPYYEEFYDEKKGFLIKLSLPTYNNRNCETSVSDSKLWTNSAFLFSRSVEQQVYNLSVEDDESYTVNNIVVHNCNYFKSNNQHSKKEESIISIFDFYKNVLDIVQPKYFIYGTGKSINKKNKFYISEALGFSPICIDAALLSAQSKKQLFWIGKRISDGTYKKLKIDVPEDKEILFSDIIDIFNNNFIIDLPIISKKQLFKNEEFKKNIDSTDCLMTVVPLFERLIPVAKRERDISSRMNLAFDTKNKKIKYSRNKNDRSQLFEARKDNKSNTLTVVEKDSYVAIPVELYVTELLKVLISESDTNVTDFKNKPKKSVSEFSSKDCYYKYIFDVNENEKNNESLFEVKEGIIMPLGKEKGNFCVGLADGYYLIRKLNVEEYKKLQTISKNDNFSAVSNSVAKRLIARSWNVDVLAHVIKETRIPEKDKIGILWGSSGERQPMLEELEGI